MIVAVCLDVMGVMITKLKSRCVNYAVAKAANRAKSGNMLQHLNLLQRPLKNHVGFPLPQRPSRERTFSLVHLSFFQCLVF